MRPSLCTENKSFKRWIIRFSCRVEEGGVALGCYSDGYSRLVALNLGDEGAGVLTVCLHVDSMRFP